MSLIMTHIARLQEYLAQIALEVGDQGAEVFYSKIPPLSLSCHRHPSIDEYMNT